MKKLLLNVAAFAIFMALILILLEVFDFSFWVVYVVAVIFYFLAAFLIEKYTVNVLPVADLEDSIIKKLKREGYQCEKEEGDLVYVLKGRRYRTHFWAVGNGSFRTEIIDYLVIDGEWDKISYEGKAVLANYVNRECPHSTFLSTDVGVVCSYITYLRDSSDFIREAQLGYNVIGDAITTATNVLPQVKLRYLTTEKANLIGFVNNEGVGNE